jgi:hypothetical protein
MAELYDVCKVEVMDRTSGETVTLYYQYPDDATQIEYRKKISTANFFGDDKKVREDTARKRIGFGKRICTGIKAPDKDGKNGYTVHGEKLEVDPEKNICTHDNWKSLLQKIRPVLFEQLAVFVFENAVAVRNAAGIDPDDDPDDDDAGTEKNLNETPGDSSGGM